jgi:hypothetical protein
MFSLMETLSDIPDKMDNRWSEAILSVAHYKNLYLLSMMLSPVEIFGMTETDGIFTDSAESSR